jgi:hypothetical protein
MLIELVQTGGTVRYISGDHIQEVTANGSGSTLLMQDGTLINVTQPPASVVAWVNASMSTPLTAHTVMGSFTSSDP